MPATDEMVLIAETAWEEARASDTDGDWMRAALDAVYPLIREAVLSVAIDHVRREIAAARRMVDASPFYGSGQKVAVAHVLKVLSADDMGAIGALLAIAAAEPQEDPAP